MYNIVLINNKNKMNKKAPKSSVIFSGESIEKELRDYLITAGEEMIKIAYKKAVGKKCKKCGKGNNLKTLPVYADPYPLPTEFILYCGNCHYSQTLIIRNKDSRMITYMKKIHEMAESAEKAIKKLNKNK